MAPAVLAGLPRTGNIPPARPAGNGAAVLCRHPAVAMAGVVAQPDLQWGETPLAYVELKPGTQATEAELIEYCRARLPHGNYRETSAL